MTAPAEVTVPDLGDFSDVPPEIVLRQWVIVGPLQEEIRGVEHDINGPFLALP